MPQSSRFANIKQIEQTIKKSAKKVIIDSGLLESTHKGNKELEHLVSQLAKQSVHDLASATQLGTVLGQRILQLSQQMDKRYLDRGVIRQLIGQGDLPTHDTSATAQIFEFDIVTVNAQGNIKEHRKGQAEHRTEDLENGVSLDLVVIPGGSFLMGSPASEQDRSGNEGPQYQVNMQSFLMGKYLVTQTQWKAVAALPKIERDLESDPSESKGNNRPVEQVSWYDAIEFCQRLSKKTGREYRLPSEAEWEYACRAGTTTPFYFGQTITTDLVNCNGNDTYAEAPKGIYREQTTDVGSFPSNAFGLYDMHGNVWEWCLDEWHDNYEGAPIDGSAWITGENDNYRLLRGGSWVDSPDYCRSAYRNNSVAGSSDDILGFRVVCAAAWTQP